MSRLPQISLNNLDRDKPSRAVIALGHGYQSCLLWWVGYDISRAIEGGADLAADGLGVEAPGVGIWIWESDEDYPESSGSFRTPTQKEWEAIGKGDPPWDPLDWLTPGARRSYEGALGKHLASLRPTRVSHASGTLIDKTALSPTAEAALEAGLQDAAEGRVHHLGSFAQYADDEAVPERGTPFEAEDTAAAVDIHVPGQQVYKAGKP